MVYDINREKIKSNFVLFCICACFFILIRSLTIALNNEYIAFPIVLACYLIIIFFINNILKKPMFMIILISLMYIFQNTIIGLSVNLNFEVSDNVIKYIIAENSLLVLVVLIYLLLMKKIKLYKYEKVGITLLIVSCIYTFVGSINMMVSLSYLRNLSLLIIFPIISRMVVCDFKNLKEFVKYILVISIVVAIFGFIERFFFSYDIWKNIFHMDKIYYAKGMLNDGDGISGFPGLWYTNIGLYTVRRMVSFFYEPVNMSYFFACGFALTFALNKKKLFIIMTLALVLCFGKGGWLVGFIAVLTILLLRKTKRNNFIKVFIGMLVLTIGLAYLYFKIMPGTALPHLSGMISIIDNLKTKPLGHGLGSGGNFSSIVNSTYIYSTLDTGSESGLGALVYKLGVCGLILYLLYFLFMGKQMVDVAIKNRSNNLGKVAICSVGLIIGLMFGIVFQENSLGPQTNHLILLLYGGVIGASRKMDCIDKIC